MDISSLRTMLGIFLMGMFLLAMLYLRRRQLSLTAYLAWGFFALLVPALGPFLVILSRPGRPLPGQDQPSRHLFRR